MRTIVLVTCLTAILIFIENKRALACTSGTSTACVCRDGQVGRQSCIADQPTECVCPGSTQTNGDCFGKWDIRDRADRHTFMIFEKTKLRYEIRQGAVAQGDTTYRLLGPADTSHGQCHISVAIEERPVCCGGPDPSEDPQQRSTRLVLVEQNGRVSGTFELHSKYGLIEKRYVIGMKTAPLPTDTMPSGKSIKNDMDSLFSMIPGHCEYAERIIPLFKGQAVNVTLVVGPEGGPDKVSINGQDLKIQDCVAAVSENRAGLFPNYTGKQARAQFRYVVP